MQFLKILFWCLLAFLAAVFTVGNWTRVEIHLWNDITALVNLPLLLLVTFLIGFLPTLAYNHAIRWRLRQRLQVAEQRAAPPSSLAVAPVVVAPAPPAEALSAPTGPTAPTAPTAPTVPTAPTAPTAVPPGIA